VYNQEKGFVELFAVNYDPVEDVKLSVDLRSFGEMTLARHTALTGNDAFAQNTPGEPNRVKPQKMHVSETKGGVIEVVLPRLSWNVMEFI